MYGVMYEMAQTQSALPAGITPTARGFRASARVKGDKRERTFSTVDEAVTWRTNAIRIMKAGGDVEALDALPPGVSARADAPGTYRVRYTAPDGGRVHRDFASREEAIQWNATARAAAEAGHDAPQRLVPVGSGINHRTVTEAVREWHADYMAEHPTTNASTVQSRSNLIERYIVPFFGNESLHTVTRNRVREFRTHMADRRLGVGGQGLALWALDRTFKHGIAAGWVTTNPAHDVRPQKPRQPRTNRSGKGVYVELADLLSALHIMSPVYRPAALLQRLCGLRIGEVFGLHLGDVDLDQRLIEVRRQGGRKFQTYDAQGEVETRPEVERTKTVSGRRVVAIPECLVPFLTAYIDTFHVPDAGPETRFMVSPKGGVLAEPYRRSLQAATNELGIRDENGAQVVPHDLRKSCATDLEMLNVRPLDRSFFMGHKIGAYDGGAAITAGTYTVQTRAVVNLLNIAEALDEHVAQAVGPHAFDGLCVDPEYAESMQAAEAASLLGWSSLTTVRALVRNGDLVAVPRRKHGSRLRITKESFAQYVETISGRVYLTELEDRYGVSARHLRHIMRGVGIGWSGEQSDPGGMGKWITTDDAKAVAEVFAARAEFFATHLNMAQAGERLGFGFDRMVSLMQRGVLVEACDEAIPATVRFGEKVPTRYVTLASVEAAERNMAAPGRTRRNARFTPPGALTYTEAATVLSSSANLIGYLVAEGKLEGVTNPIAPARRFVTESSVRKYAEGRKPYGADGYVAHDAALMTQWDRAGNPGLDPSTVLVGSGVVAAWKCETCGYSWQAPVKQRYRQIHRSAGCPACHNKVVVPGFNDQIGRAHV